MSCIIMFLLLHILISILCTITSLPVTSKPIENTPEHLAWEAWIMVPSNHDKSRKITPKSIFIVPNATNGGNGLNVNGGEKNSQMRCPPGHTVDNSKCIPTVSIDQNQILITRLTNLVHSTDRYNGSGGDVNDSYDYDYEYDTYEADESQAFPQTGIGNENKNSSVSLSSSSSDYSGEPLKINLSLEKIPIIIDQNKEEDTRRNTEKMLVRKKEILVVTTTQSPISQTLKLDDTISTVRTVDTTIFPRKTDSSMFEKSPLELKTEVVNNSMNSVPLLSPSETELLTTVSSDVNSTTTKDVLDYDLDDKLTTHLTTTEDEIELVTNINEIKNVTLKDEIKKDSLIVEEIDSKTTDVVSETTETEDQVFTTLLNEDQTSQFHDQSKPHESFEVHDDAAPLMETIESDNRFLYHHFGTTKSISNMQTNPKIETTTPTNINKQLQIINQIVEENKKRAMAMQHIDPVRQISNSKIVFPEDGDSHASSNQHNRYENLHPDYVKYPKNTVVSSSRLIPMPALHKPPLDSLYPSDRFHQSPSLQQPQIVNINSNIQQNSKPFWWLPTGWEVDRTGERPMMVRFWSRIPVEQSGNLHNRHQTLTPPSSLMTTATTTTNINRENSRSPTENLFKQEILAQQQQHQQQDIYSMSRPKQWKHNNR